MKPTILLLAAVTVLSLGVWPARPQSFSIRDLSVTNVLGMEARAINNKGQVVGTYDPRRFEYLSGGWVWSPTPENGLSAGHSFILPPRLSDALEGNSMEFIDINDRGQILAPYYGQIGADPEPDQHLGVWQSGRLTELVHGQTGALPGEGGLYIQNPEGRSINNNGLVIGALFYCYLDQPQIDCFPFGCFTNHCLPRGALFQQWVGTQYQLLPQDVAVIGHLNSRNEAAGSYLAGGERRGCIWQGGGVKDFAVLSGGFSYFPTVINDLGQVIGVTTNTGPARVFFYTPTPFAGLPAGVTLITPSNAPCAALFLNNRGSFFYSFAGQRFLWLNGTSANFTNFAFSNFGNVDVRGLNDDGWIVGNAVKAGGGVVPVVMQPRMDLKVAASTNRVRLGEQFDVRVKATSLVSNDLPNMFPLIPLRIDGMGGAQILSGPVPATAQTLVAGSNLVFTYTLRATNAGAVTFTSQVRGSNAVIGRVTSLRVTSDPLLVVEPADLLVKLEKEPDTKYAGNGIYLDKPGPPQERKVEIEAGSETAFTVRVQNDANTNRSLALKVVETTNAGWRISYLTGTKDISAALRSGSYHTAMLAPGKFETLTARMLSETNATPGTGWTVLLSVHDQPEDLFALDVAGLTVRAAPELIVNVDGDQDDANPNDGVLDVDLTKPGQQVTLRAAINYANSPERPGLDVIKFNIPVSGGPVGTASDGAAGTARPPPFGSLVTILAKRPLPAITDPLILNGTNLLGGLIQLDGALAGLTDGLRVFTSNSVLRNLAVTRFGGAGISIQNGKDIELLGNLIGTDLNGTTGFGNREGIRVSNSDGVTLGGTLASRRNLISGNSSNGVSLMNSSNVEVRANYIGTDPSGSRNLPNGGVGLLAQNVQQFFLGSTGALSVINGPLGALLKGIGGGKMVNCNVGLNAAGTAPLGGTTTGVCVEDSTGLTVGGPNLDDMVAISGVLSNALELRRTVQTKLQGTLLGTDRTGSVPIGNGGFGVMAEQDVDTEIGETDAPVVISGGGGRGIGFPGRGGIAGFGSSGLNLNRLLIGIGLTNGALGTLVGGILANQTTNMTIGKGLLGSIEQPLRVVIANLSGNGIQLKGTSGTRILATALGTDMTGLFGRTNAGFAVVAEDDVDTQIGETDSPVIVGGGGLGGFSLSRSASLKLNRALIGMGLNGDFLGNLLSGIIASQTTNMTIGGPLLASFQSLFGAPPVVVSGTISNALQLFGTRNTGILGTSIGTDLTGLFGRTNGGFAMLMEDDEGTRIGGSNAPVVVGSSGKGGFSFLRSLGPVLQNVSAGLNGTNALPLGGPALRAQQTTNLAMLTKLLETANGLLNTLTNVMANSASNCIELLGTRNTRIEGTMIGTDGAGTMAQTNGGFGIVMENDENTQIGETNAPVVVGSSGKGGIAALASRGCFLKGVLAGVRPVIDSAFREVDMLLANGGPNLFLNNISNMIVGGTSPFGQCIFSGSPTNSVELFRSLNVLFQNCRVGTDATGQIPFPNRGNGIVIGSNSMNITIGGPLGNIIRNSGQNGVQMLGALSNINVQNTVIASNLAKAISRPVNGQGFPAITNSFRGSTHVEGTVAGRPNETLRLEFFGHRAGTGGGPGEGELLLGSVDVTLNSGGFGSYNTAFSRSVPAGWRVAATTTDSIYGTSEFSPGRNVVPAPDSDGDGMPDFWEALHARAGLNPNVPNDPRADFDGDGFTNLQEYLANTDPEKPDSFLHIDDLVVGKAAQITFTAADGRQYGLDRSPDLKLWTRVATAAPDGGQVTLSDPSPPANIAHYRIVAEFP